MAATPRKRMGPAASRRRSRRCTRMRPEPSYSRLSNNSKGGIEMKRRFINSQRLLLAVGSLALGASLMAMPVPRNHDNQQAAPDTTKQNKDQTSPTADQQKMNPADRAITQKIRKAVHDDTSLSTYA